MSFLVKDLTIKLFGKTIPLPLNHSASIPNPSAISDLSHTNNSSTPQILLSATSYPKINYVNEEDDDDKENSRKEFTPDRLEVSASNQNTESAISENSRTCSVERENSVERETSELKQTEEETPKKPDKLIPCPRCKSMKTKFCYYNNYNVNQPRHFCKNCQRYWTAGGTMRRVPVGAGRRKSKNSSISPYQQTLETANASNGTVLTFGSSPLKPQNWIQHCFTEQSGDDHSSRSSLTGSNSPENEIKTTDQEQPPKKFKPSPLQWSSQFQPPFFQSSFYPDPIWGCALPRSWILPSSSPPTLRINDLNEAPKSSINGGKLFNGFHSKADERSHFQPSSILHANPAALSRSLKFHERS